MTADSLPNHGFGGFCRQHRLDQERSMRWLARHAGISTTHVWQIEKGESEPSLRVALALARALCVPIEQMVLQRDWSEEDRYER